MRFKGLSEPLQYTCPHIVLSWVFCWLSLNSLCHGVACPALTALWLSRDPLFVAPFCHRGLSLLPRRRAFVMWHPLLSTTRYMSRKSRLGGPYLTIAWAQLIRGTKSLAEKSKDSTELKMGKGFASHSPTFRMVTSTFKLGPVQIWGWEPLRCSTLNGSWQGQGLVSQAPPKPSHCRSAELLWPGPQAVSLRHALLLCPQLLRQGAVLRSPGEHSWKPGGTPLHCACLYPKVLCSSTLCLLSDVDAAQKSCQIKRLLLNLLRIQINL